MSHFNVLVVTDQKPTGEVLEAALQPFHEFECTGINDQYVVEVDVTEETKREFEEYGEGESLEDHLEGWNGFKVVKPGQGIDTDDIHKHGYVIVDEQGNIVKAIDRTNPNKKWDWWKIGGRWSGMLISKNPAEAIKGRPGILGSRYSETGYDGCQVKDLDLSAMLKEKRDAIYCKRQDAYIDAVKDAKFSWLREPGAWERWDKLGKEGGESEKALRKSWEEQGKKGRFAVFFENELMSGNPFAKTLKEAMDVGYGFMGIPLGQTCDEAMAAVLPLSCFAVLMDGKWYERGEMGWWAMVSNENKDWDQEFKKLLESLDPEKWVTVVDCHI